MPPENNLDPAAREAIHKARDAQQAVEVARLVQSEEAAERTSELTKEKMQGQMVDADHMGKIVRREVIDVLSLGTERERAVVLARIPYICADIKNIDERLALIQEALRYMPIIQKLVFGIITMMLTSIVGALLALVISK